MIIEAGGKQHLVVAGARVVANRVDVAVGGTVQSKNLLDGKPVTLTVVAHTFGPKINGLKFKNKVRYLKRYGHRQAQSVLEVAGGAVQADKKSDNLPKKKVTTKAKKGTAK